MTTTTTTKSIKPLCKWLPKMKARTSIMHFSYGNRLDQFQIQIESFYSSTNTKLPNFSSHVIQSYQIVAEELKPFFSQESFLRAIKSHNVHTHSLGGSFRISIHHKLLHSFQFIFHSLTKPPKSNPANGPVRQINISGEMKERKSFYTNSSSTLTLY